MRGGHNKKPTAQHKADGTFQPVRHANRLELKPLPNTPPPPADFDAEHKAKWNEVCGLLYEAEILAKPDPDAIRMYVESTLMARKLLAEVKEEGFVLADGKRNPKWLSYLDCAKRQQQLFSEFGFTPRARMGMKVESKDKPPADPAAFLFEN